MTSLELADPTNTIRHLWNNQLPELSTEETPTLATSVMWTTRLIYSSDDKVKKVIAKRGTVATSDEEEIKQWAALCFTQIGATIVTEPIYSLAHVIIPEVESVAPLKLWDAERPSLVIHPPLGVEAIVSPTGSFTDIHTDATTIGRAVCVEQCEKLWFLWPPTAQNLLLWSTHRGLAISLVRYGAELEGGLVVRTQGNDETRIALTMPAGTLHSVFTITGGFLLGVNYSTGEDIQLAGTMLEIQVSKSQDEDQIDDDCRWFLNTAKEILSHRPGLVLECLTSMARVLASIANHRKKGHKAWKYFQARATSQYQQFRNGKLKCDCGENFPPTCHPHFVEVSHGINVPANILEIRQRLSARDTGQNGQ